MEGKEKGEKVKRERQRREKGRERGYLSERGNRKRKSGSEAASRKGVGVAYLLKRQQSLH